MKLKVFGPPGFDFDKEFPPAPPNPLGENAAPITDDHGNHIGWAEMQETDTWSVLYIINNEWIVDAIDPFGNGGKEHKFTSEQEARDFIEQRKKLFRQINNG